MPPMILWYQRSFPRFVPMEVLHKVNTSTPDVACVRVGGWKDTEQVLDVPVPRHDPTSAPLLQCRMCDSPPAVER